MRIARRSSRRRGIAGIIGAVILFTLLFTIGTEYFIFVNNANNLETQSLVNRGNTLAARLQENALLTTSLSTSNTIQFYLNNTGGQTLNVTSILLFSGKGTLLACEGGGLPGGQGCTANSGLPLVANVGRGGPAHGYVDTDYNYTTGTDTLDVITSNGNIFSATYPQTGVSLAAQALSSGAIGDLYLSLATYRYYNLTNIGCPAASDSSGWCFAKVPGSLAYVIPAALSTKTNLAFSVQVTDLNPTQLNITLDQYSYIEELGIQGQAVSGLSWYIISNSSTTILNHYTPVTLQYDKPVTLFFASGVPACYVGEAAGTAQCNNFTPLTPVLNGNKVVPSGFQFSVFIISHGWKGMALSKQTAKNTNYGQNSPYVTTLYY